MAGTIVTVIGDTIDLYVEADEDLQPDVSVTFTATSGSENAVPLPKLPPVFTDRLIARPSPLRPAPNTAPVASRIQWTVNLDKADRERLITVTLQAQVTGKLKSGRNVSITVSEVLRVVGVPVTTDPKLTRIMLHEFSTDEPRPLFDRDPPELFSTTLRPNQRKLLLQRAQENPNGRLVVFVTLYDTATRKRRMRADLFDNAVRANAMFTVFHCEDPLSKRGMTLISHTEHFVVNFFNPTTHEWIRRKVGGRTANAYMHPDTDQPVKYLLGAALPSPAHDAAIYMVVCQADGTSIMGKNYVHGLVNTHGCWMLFRNFNWPLGKADTFEAIYLRDRKNPTANVKAELAAAGYNDAGVPGSRSSSVEKWFFYDRNFAFSWFCHEVIGIKYFSARSWIERDKFPQHAFPSGSSHAMNDHDTHGRILSAVFDFANERSWQSFQPGTLAYHDAGDSASFKPTDALWGNNAMGLRTSPGFAAESFPKRVPPERAWADLYFYRENSSVDLSPTSQLVDRNAVSI